MISWILEPILAFALLALVIWITLTNLLPSEQKRFKKKNGKTEEIV